MAHLKYQLDIHILHEVASRPMLWDIRTDEYKESEKKPVLWLEIAEKLHSTPVAVKARFDSIRGSYRRYRIAMNKHSVLGKSGSGVRSLKQPKPYKYATECAFLDAVFKPISIVESMDLGENNSNKGGDEDLTDSISSVEENTVLESNRSGRKRKKSTELDFNTVFKDAVQSIGKLSSSVKNSRKKEEVDDLDDDWLFAKTIYVKLKNVPTRKAKERFKVRILTELMDLMYDDQNTDSTRPELDPMNFVQHQTPLHPIIVYEQNQAAGYNNTQYLSSNTQVTSPVQIFSTVPTSSSCNLSTMNFKHPFDVNILHEWLHVRCYGTSERMQYKESEKKPDLWIEIAEKLQSTPGVVKGRFDSIRGSYRRYWIAMQSVLGKSGSDVRSLRRPKAYKYATECAFLDAVFKMKSMDSGENNSNKGDEDLTDSISSVGENIVLESNRRGRKQKRSWS